MTAWIYYPVGIIYLVCFIIKWIFFDVISIKWISGHPWTCNITYFFSTCSIRIISAVIFLINHISTASYVSTLIIKTYLKNFRLPFGCYGCIICKISVAFVDFSIFSNNLITSIIIASEPVACTWWNIYICYAFSAAGIGIISGVVFLIDFTTAAWAAIVIKSYFIDFRLPLGFYPSVVRKFVYSFVSWPRFTIIGYTVDHLSISIKKFCALTVPAFKNIMCFWKRTIQTRYIFYSTVIGKPRFPCSLLRMCICSIIINIEIIFIRNPVSIDFSISGKFIFAINCPWGFIKSYIFICEITVFIP